MQKFKAFISENLDVKKYHGRISRILTNSHQRNQSCQSSADRHMNFINRLQRNMNFPIFSKNCLLHQRITPPPKKCGRIVEKKKKNTFFHQRIRKKTRISSKILPKKFTNFIKRSQKGKKKHQRITEKTLILSKDQRKKYEFHQKIAEKKPLGIFSKEHNWPPSPPPCKFQQRIVKKSTIFVKASKKGGKKP